MVSEIVIFSIEDHKNASIPMLVTVCGKVLYFPP